MPRRKSEGVKKPLNDFQKVERVAIAIFKADFEDVVPDTEVAWHETEDGMKNIYRHMAVVAIRALE